MSNAALQLVTLVIFGAHAGALALFVTRRERAAVQWIVAAVAVAILAAILLRLMAFFAPRDWPVLLLAAFEVFALVAVARARAGSAIAKGFIILAFASHALASVLALVFAFAFRMTRLF